MKNDIKIEMRNSTIRKNTVTVKLGYNEQLGTGQICSLYPEFVITELVNVVNMDLG